MNNIPKRVLEYCRKHELIATGEKILIGLSGGMDSVCLFDILFKLKEEIGFELYAIHVEHGIRGESSRADMEFVKELCEKRGVDIRIFCEDVPAYAKSEKLTMEEAARIIRYRDFERALKELDADKTAVAHHMNDQAETVLFNMLRGSSLKGMAGMSPKRGKIIRPLLFLSRDEIDGYVTENGLSYVTDETNDDSDYSRNRIRHLILPQMENVVKGAAEHIFRQAQEIASACEYIDGEAERFCREHLKKDTSEPCVYRMDITALAAESEIVAREAIKQVLTLMCSGFKDISSVNIRDIYGLTEKTSGRTVDIPYGIKVKRIGNELVFKRDTDDGQRRVLINEPLDLKDEQILTDGTKIRCRIFEKGGDVKYPQNDYTKWFDYDKIISGKLPEVRTRQTDDRIAIDKNGNYQSLKKFFINNKIPSDKRDEVKLLTKDNDVIWIIGYRISESFKICPDTKKIIEIEISGGKDVE
ncbi:MAG: tRNA lysidine(34) synthetase TilS [Lachnospiraceae bacterium]|nr:tRNA lysidine(34) synthetase TilS [Lachnospiraceae bacterium]